MADHVTDDTDHSQASTSGEQASTSQNPYSGNFTGTTAKPQKAVVPDEIETGQISGEDFVPKSEDHAKAQSKGGGRRTNVGTNIDTAQALDGEDSLGILRRGAGFERPLGANELPHAGGESFQRHEAGVPMVGESLREASQSAAVPSASLPPESVGDFLTAVPGPSPEPSPRPALDFSEASDNMLTNSSLATPGSESSFTGDVDSARRRYHVQYGNAGAPTTPVISYRGPPGSQSPPGRNDVYRDEGSDAPPSLLENRSAQTRGGDAIDIVLPRWQPDAEVTYCPICNTQFSFFVRKHHCRKCGRVVCNACSPHRITIPYQFIVQPPSATPISESSSVSFNPDMRDSQRRFIERHGGMKVRLCNPCVPDPNTLPHQTSGREDRWGDAPPSYYLNSGNHPFTLDEEAMNNLERDSGTFATSRQRELLSSRARGMSAASGLTAVERRQDQGQSGRHGSTASDMGAGSSYPSSSSPRMSARNEPQGSSRSPRPSYYGNVSQTRGHGSRQQSLSVGSTGTPNPQANYRSLLNMVGDTHSNPLSSDHRPLPAVPRIAEEDECPICHQELAPRTIPDFEDVRAAHIMKCIDEQIAIHSGHAPRPRASTYASLSDPAPGSSATRDPSPSANQAGTSSAEDPASRAPSASSSALPPVPSSSRPVVTTPTADTPEARMAAREEAHAAVVLGASRAASGHGHNYGGGSSSSGGGRRTAMFPYKATEKDCVDDAECTICLEEFEVGVSMARLECLCRFHRHCIQEWFVSHPGRCPVHQHDGYGF
ncbi:MAG: hypothetical protein M1818_003419 [Claussenomyces sp. TS43310]|nr:MAG: hypothetical protein M1818_003419 [Claussenomyces sp. TS43310]